MIGDIVGGCLEDRVAWFMSDGEWHYAEEVAEGLGISRHDALKGLRHWLRRGEVECKDNRAIRRRWLYRMPGGCE
jgi:hypothetical protein